MSNEKNKYLGGYDRPILKDWAFWWTASWGALFAYIGLFPPASSTSTAPKGLDSFFYALIGLLIFGYPVAILRRVVRSLMARRRNATDMPVQPQAAPPQDAVPNSTPEPFIPRDFPRPVAFTAAPAPQPSQAGPILSSSPKLLSARGGLPYPIARAARALQVNPDPLEQYLLLLDLGEAISSTVGVLAVSWIREHAPQDGSLIRLQGAFSTSGVSQGHWHEAIAGALRLMTLDSQNALKGFVSGMSKSAKQPGVLTDLGALVEERNLSAHGGRPHTRGEAMMRIESFTPTVERLLVRLDFMKLHPWVLVEGVAYRRQEKSFDTRVSEVMNDHPEFESKLLSLKIPLANDTFYALADPGGPLDLTPFVVMRYCKLCQHPETFFADRVSNRGVSLKSIARGHQIYDEALTSEFQALTGRRLPGSGPSGE